jgi:hypothetical protein
MLCSSNVSANGESEPIQFKRYALFELAGAGDRFDGQGVVVFGFLRYKAMLRLYLTSDHARFSDIGSSIVVIDATPGASIIQSPCESSYVHLIGTIGQVDNGLFGIVAVKAIRAADSEEICWKREE